MGCWAPSLWCRISFKPSVILRLFLVSSCSSAIFLCAASLKLSYTISCLAAWSWAVRESTLFYSCAASSCLVMFHRSKRLLTVVRLPMLALSFYISKCCWTTNDSVSAWRNKKYAWCQLHILYYQLIIVAFINYRGTCMYSTYYILYVNNNC